MNETAGSAVASANIVLTVVNAALAVALFLRWAL